MNCGKILMLFNYTKNLTIKNTINNVKPTSLSRLRHFFKNMDCPDLHPPDAIRGMTELDKDMFRKIIRVPKLKILDGKINKVLPIVKTYMLKMERLRPVRTVHDGNGGQCEKEILLHPLAAKTWEALPKALTDIGLENSCFTYENLELSYENWKADEILKFILPPDRETLTSYSRVGHVVHINLRDHLLPYKNIIGEVLKEKIPGCRTVVNKSQNISNTYRNFELELICGDPDYNVQVKENGVCFEFDFSKVYWNPRLSTEHERIVNLLNKGDVLYDIFAGVGPFSIPAASKKKCHVFANDLNPESFKWLNINAKKNKCLDNIKTYNKDGRDFILEDIKRDLAIRWKNTEKNYKIHITMNLPALAVDFIDAFCGLFSQSDLNLAENMISPLVHVYAFSKEDENSVLQAAENVLNCKLGENLEGIYFVRNVAPNKDMFRISFYLSRDIIFSSNSKRTLSEEPSILCKKQCI